MNKITILFPVPLTLIFLLLVGQVSRKIFDF